MECLSYYSLQEAYRKALELNLDDNFIVMIEDELSKRSLKSNKEKLHHHLL